MKYATHVSTPLGTLVLISDGTALCTCITQQMFDKMRFSDSDRPQPKDDLAIFNYARAWLTTYFEGKDPGATPALAPDGSAFRQRTWNMLSAIPYGSTTTYSKIAHQMEQESGGRMAAQAVGGAVGANPLMIFIPCHRVVGTSGNLTGYAGGIPMKRALLTLEGVDVSKFKDPVSS